MKFKKNKRYTLYNSKLNNFKQVGFLFDYKIHALSKL